MTLIAREAHAKDAQFLVVWASKDSVSGWALSLCPCTLAIVVGIYGGIDLTSGEIQAAPGTNSDSVPIDGPFVL